MATFPIDFRKIVYNLKLYLIKLKSSIKAS